MDTAVESLELVALPSVGPQPAWLAPIVRCIFPRRAKEIITLFEAGGVDIDPDKDHPHAIKLSGEYIGITGYYHYDDQSVGLCWHGITPAVRGRGVSRAAFDEVCRLALAHYPHACEIVELIPSDREAVLVEYFEQLGFRHDGEIATREYLPDGPVWRVYRAPLIEGETCCKEPPFRGAE